VSKKVKDIYIDADHILYLVAYSQNRNPKFTKRKGSFKGGKKPKVDIKSLKADFKYIVDLYTNTAEVESVLHKWTTGKTHVILSDKTNFRFEVYPEYKHKRTEEKTPEFKALRKWAQKKYRVEPNTEADDVVSYYARKGHIVITTDKDVYKGNEGYFYNSHYASKKWIKTSKEEAEHFFKLQVLAGDPTDNIPALKSVGLPTAEKLLVKYNGDVEKIYLDRGYTKEYMIQMGRLVSMNQWSPKKGVTLWQGW